MRVKVIPSVKSGLMCVQVGVIGGSGFYKLEELENTKQITVVNSFICKLIPGSRLFSILLFRIFYCMGVQLLQLTINCLILLKRYRCDLLDLIALSFNWDLYLLFWLFLWQQHSTRRSNGSLAKFSLQVDTRWGEAKVVVGTLGGVDVVLLARYSRIDPCTWQGLLRRTYDKGTSSSLLLGTGHPTLSHQGKSTTEPIYGP